LPHQSTTLLDAEMAAAGRILRRPHIVIMVVAVQRIGTAAATVAVIFANWP
jgi:transporter family-2 protein